MNRKKRLAALEKEIHSLEFSADKNRIGRFEPRLIPLYREYRRLKMESTKMLNDMVSLEDVHRLKLEAWQKWVKEVNTVTFDIFAIAYAYKQGDENGYNRAKEGG